MLGIMELHYLAGCCVMLETGWKRLGSFRHALCLLFLSSDLEKAPTVLQTAKCRELFGI